MISFFVGTTAELIKMAPVYHELAERGARPRLWYTGQHVAGVPELLGLLGMAEPDLWLARGARGRTIERPMDVPSWGGSLLAATWRQRHELARQLNVDGRPLIMVHGDTFTTLIGAVLGRLLGADVAHVEAGLRSGSLRSPFPEEANRRLAARFTDVHFAPTDREIANLAGTRGRIIATHANTVVDSIRLLRGRAATGDAQALPSQYGVSTLHRFELLRDESRLREIVHVLRDSASSGRPILFFAGSHEVQRLREMNLMGCFDDQRLQLRKKLPYGPFLQVLAGASFVITDSGGLQEECAYLGIPCLVHRGRTERHQGLGENVVLSRLEISAVCRFLDTYEVLRVDSELAGYQPSKVIVDTLVELGYVRGRL